MVKGELLELSFYFGGVEEVATSATSQTVANQHVHYVCRLYIHKILRVPYMWLFVKGSNLFLWEAKAKTRGSRGAAGAGGGLRQPGGTVRRGAAGPGRGAAEGPRGGRRPEQRQVLWALLRASAPGAVFFSSFFLLLFFWGEVSEHPEFFFGGGGKCQVTRQVGGLKEAIPPSHSSNVRRVCILGVKHWAQHRFFAGSGGLRR